MDKETDKQTYSFIITLCILLIKLLAVSTLGRGSVRDWLFLYTTGLQYNEQFVKAAFHDTDILARMSVSVSWNAACSALQYLQEGLYTVYGGRVGERASLDFDDAELGALSLGADLVDRAVGESVVAVVERADDDVRVMQYVALRLVRRQHHLALGEAVVTVKRRGDGMRKFELERVADDGRSQ